MNINAAGYSTVNRVQSFSGTQRYSSVNNIAFKAEEADKVEIKKQEGNLTKAEKQEIIKSARTKAAGWSIFGGLFSTLYYGLRSNNTVAEKYDLDPEKDKALVEKIKQDQTLFTLPAIVGFGLVGWIVSKVMSSANIDPDHKTL